MAKPTQVMRGTLDLLANWERLSVAVSESSARRSRPRRSSADPTRAFTTNSSSVVTV